MMQEVAYTNLLMDNVQEKLQKIRLAIDRLVEKANQDGVITDEEAKLLKKAEEGLEAYEKMVDAALEDGIITQDERNQLIDLEEQLLSDSYYTAMEDEKIDNDELLLLKTLIQTLDPRASVSWLDEDTE